MASSPSSAEQLVTNHNPLAKDIHSGNLSAAPQDYVTLSQDALNNSASGRMAIGTGPFLDIALPSGGASALVSGLHHLGADLAGKALNDVPMVLGALSTMSLSTMLGSDPTVSVKSVEEAQLIQETIRALMAGDSSAVNNDLSQLASLLSNLQRINYGEQAGDNDDVFSSNSTSQLAQTMEGDVSSLTPYDLSLLAWHLFGSVPPNSEQYGDRETRKKLRRISSRRFAEAQWSVIVFLAGFREPDDLREALAYIFSEESLRGFANRLRRETDPACIPKWQRELIDEIAACIDLNKYPG
jgi:hypothetical protein